MHRIIDTMIMEIKALVIDFDKTITTEDMSDLLAERVGKKEESERLGQLFFEGKLPGLTGLIQRINFLSGLSVGDLQELVNENDYLRAGAVELFQFLKQHGIVSIISSGSTIPFLQLYQEKLGADYLVGSKPKMNGDVIDSISEEDYSGVDFKSRDTRTILDTLGISPNSLVAIGDSPADKGLFELAAVSIAINPQAGVGALANHIIQDDLSLAIPILEELMD